MKWAEHQLYKKLNLFKQLCRRHVAHIQLWDAEDREERIIGNKGAISCVFRERDTKGAYVNTF